MEQQKSLILASGSPRRKELLQQAGFSFRVIPSNVEENITGRSPEEIVKELSCQKAQDVFGRLGEEEEKSLVLGADTIVACEDEEIEGKFRILGKPKNREDAFHMLKQLQGRSHFVYTGVSLIWMEGDKVRKERFAVGTQVSFYPMEDEEIFSYIETGEPMDKAGAYGIQGKGAVYIKEIKGDYNNVVGLPLGELYQTLKNNHLLRIIKNF